MSRSGYTEDNDDNWSMICWRGAVSSALRGKRGQAFLRELAEAMDAMPVKRLVDGVLEADGEFCTLGVIAKARGVKAEHPDCVKEAQRLLDIADAMAREIVYENDEAGHYTNLNPLTGRYEPETPEQRWTRMRGWVDKQISQSREA